MMNTISKYFQSSIGKKQIVAVTGLLLIGFIIGHLAGNLFIFLGEDAFNNYAKKLAGLRPGLYVVETALALIFFIHLYVTACLVMENIKARQKNYHVFRPFQRSLATKLMPYTGTVIFIFVIWHLLDFTFVDKHGDKSFLADGISHGLYGVVVNAFKNPLHSLLYIAAVGCLGFHLSHGVESFLQTFGFNDARYTPVIKKISCYFALLVVGGYSAIPIYVLLVI
jgi:succinate dehydrogenase / fumarate reductase cytochrome b subunit